MSSHNNTFAKDVSDRAGLRELNGGSEEKNFMEQSQRFSSDEEAHEYAAVDVEQDEEAGLAMAAAKRRLIRTESEFITPRRVQSASVAAFGAPRKGLKRPYREPTPEPDEMDEGDQPDLEEYFSNWHIAPKEVILLCRSYASYVSASLKATKK